MDFPRFNAVGLITGAASGLGAACSVEMARRSQGGLILIDPDERALDRIANDLDDAAPERVSMLAFDAGDADTWTRAQDFIQSQYGRLDWAIVNVAAAPTEKKSDLVEWKRVLPAQLEAVVRTLRVLMPMMAKNTLGGAIVVTAPAAALSAEKNKAGLADLVRAAGVEAAAQNVHVNAVVTDGQQSPLWKKLPWLADLRKQGGDEAGAAKRIAKLPAPVVRHDAAPGALVMSLLSDETPLNGVTLIVDGAAKA